MTDLRDDVRDAFRARFGHTPQGIWSAPGRVNLIGEHTDYNEGFVLPFAIDRRTLVAAGPREDSTLRLASTFDDEDTLYLEVPMGELDALQALTNERGSSPLEWAAYPVGVAWALGRAGADLAAVPGLDLMFDSNVPVGAGLSSSAAIECAAALALDDLWRLGLSRQQLANAGQLAENEFAGAPTGIMDQTASLLGVRDAAVLLDCRMLETETVPLGLDEAGLTTVVIDTGVAHEHSTGGYADRRLSCGKAAVLMGVPSLRDLGPGDLDRAEAKLSNETFRRMRHVITENQRVLDAVDAIRDHDHAALGELLDASHRSMRDDFEISTPELDLAVEIARENGALGARMTGGGFGGSAIALAPLDAVSRIQVAVDGGFAEHGFGMPEVFTVAPSDGAARDA
ncbi:MAG TPA: galactokinase [Pseudolysinimonas sp.]|nr:galactokinase [Pseudolysinimonas sp.]